MVRRVFRLVLVVAVVLVILAVLACARCRAREGNLFGSLRLHDLDIRRNGQPIASIERVDVEYDLFRVARGELAIDRITLTSPVIHIDEGGAGIPLFNLFRRDSSATQNPPRAFEIDSLVIVDGRIVIDPSIDDIETVEYRQNCGVCRHD